MKKLAASTMVAAWLLAMMPAHAASATGNYIAPFGRLIVSNVPANGTSFGGFVFTLEGGDPSTIKVVDSAGAGVAITVCQEAGAAETAPGSCQDGVGGQLPGDDIVQKLCTTGGEQSLRPAFVSGTDTIGVFVYVTDFTQREPACPTNGSSGTITIKY